MCPDPKCSNIKTELLEQAISGMLEKKTNSFIPGTRKTGPFKTVQEAEES